MKIIFLAILVMLSACSCLKYQSDLGLISSATAKVDVFPIQINGQFCKSHNNIYGLCAFSLKRDVPTRIKIIPLPYSYSISIDCTNALGFEVDNNIDKETIKEYEITPNHYTAISETFYCKGEIYPNGKRPASVSFKLLVALADTNYVDLAQPTLNDDKIILGQYAYKSVCCKNKECIFMTKKTYVKDKNFDLCYTETEAGRGSVYVR